MASDLISRSALLAEYDRVHVGNPGGARKLIEEAPAVDAVEVVRCKECFKRNDPSRCPMCYDEWYYDDDDGNDFIRHDNTIDDGFCNVGAKMDGKDTNVPTKEADQ